MSRLFVTCGTGHLVVAMTNHEKPRIVQRPGRFASNERGWRSLPVEGSAHWRRITGADRRARRVKLLIILAVAAVGLLLGILKEL
jgi:hypothetical protein